MDPDAEVTTPTRGSLTFVVHAHSPLVVGHGVWPVGEEWLYQAAAATYIPLFATLTGLSDLGFKNVMSLGITPILAAQLDDPTFLEGLHTWLWNWRLRAHEICPLHPARDYEIHRSQQTLTTFQQRFSRGFSPVVRRLQDSGTIEILSGPLTHPFMPGMTEEFADIALRSGMNDARSRWNLGNSHGIWLPECAYRPGMENVFENAGVSHFMVDEPAVSARGGVANVCYQLGQSNVHVIARDAYISDLLWSPIRGYPGSSAYRDFHQIDLDTGIKLSKVGDKNEREKPDYEPEQAQALAIEHAHHFVNEVAKKLDDQRLTGFTPHVVVGIDAELLGHWWSEGIEWLTHVITEIEHHSIATVTLNHITRKPSAPIDLPESSWGAGKHWDVWTGDLVRDIVVMNHQAQESVSRYLAQKSGDLDRETEALNELMYLLSSDWAFMVSRESASQYARERAMEHYQKIHTIISQENHGVDSPGKRMNWFPMVSFSR